MSAQVPVHGFPFPEEDKRGWTTDAIQPPKPVETPPVVSLRHSEGMGKLALALAKAQLNFKPIFKQNENPAFRSKYADLSTVIDATQEALAKEELVVIQSPTTKGKDLTLTTMLLHSSGEWLASDLSMPATMRDRFDAQAIGSAITYARRYSLQAVIGVAAELDDDANAAVDQGSQKAANAVAERKIAEHKAKSAVKAGASLFYSWSDADQKGYVTGDKDLMTANKELLLFKGKFDRATGFVVVDADGLDALKFELGERGVPFALSK